jgi:hypothetical protein
MCDIRKSVENPPTTRTKHLESENARKRFKNSAVIMIMAYFHHDEATIVEEPYSDDDGVKPKMKPNTNTTKEKKRYHVR